MTKAAVLGSPIAHSLSPILHRAAYAELGLDWTYQAVEVREADLPAVLEDGWVGLSLTMPLKRAVLPLLDEVSPLAAAVGAANTVTFDGDGRRRGENTDVYGIVTALAEAGVTAPASAIVLGGGATAASALAALRDLGLTKSTIAVREPVRAAEAVAAADRLEVKVEVAPLARLADLLPADLVISTLPAGATDPYARLIATTCSAVFDVVYARWPTPLITATAEAGATVAGGFSMLLHQAVRQVTLMTGRSDVPVGAMRAAGVAALS